MFHVLHATSPSMIEKEQSCIVYSLRKFKHIFIVVADLANYLRPKLHSQEFANLLGMYLCHNEM